MVHTLVSSKRIVAKIIADLDLSEDKIKISDFQEWIGEAIEKIGSVNQYIPKVSGADGAPILEIKGYQAALPCDLHQLHSVAYAVSCNGPWKPMRKAVGSFPVWDCCDGSCISKDFNGHYGNACGSCHPNMLIKDEVLVELMIDIYGDLDKKGALEILNTNQNAKTVLSNLINLHTKPTVNRMHHCLDLQYNIKPGYVLTNIPCGYLKLSYSAIPTDEEGYVMIPDMASYFEAIYWYVTMKFKYPEYLRGEMTQRIYYDIRRSWNFYRQQAYAESLLPNEDELESIQNTWLQIYPEVRSHKRFLNTVGQEQIIYNR